MANNVLKSWLGGFQPPTIAPTPPGYRPSLHPGAGWTREEWLKWWNAQPGEPRMSPFAPGYQVGIEGFDEGSEARKLFPLAAQTYPTPTSTEWRRPSIGPMYLRRPIPTPTLPGRALRRTQRRAEWLRRRQAPTQALSNYPRLPQSWIPTPKERYPTPGRPSGIREMRPGYRNLFARRPEYRNLFARRPEYRNLFARRPEYRNPYRNPFAWRRSKGTWW